MKGWRLTSFKKHLLVTLMVAALPAWAADQPHQGAH